MTLNFFTEEDDETVIGEADADISLPQYLPDQKQDGPLNIPTHDLFNNSYMHIVHTNGLHHLVMVSCQCHGADLLPSDLIASASGNTNLALAVFGCLWESLIVFANDWVHFGV